MALAQTISRIAKDWEHAPYYDQAETWMNQHWSTRIYPFIEGSDFTTVVDLAAGHGRNTVKLLEHAQKVWVVDVNDTNIEFCKKRFAENSRVEYIICDGATLRPIPDSSITLVYSYDAMVHFDSDIIRSYLVDIRRVLKQHGRAFLHHSNTKTNPTGDFHQTPGWRNFMTMELMAHWAAKEGLSIIKQLPVDWCGDGTILDGFTLLAKR